MSDIKQAKANLLKMLDGPVDQALLNLGFKRRKGTLLYRKELPESVQDIEFATDFFPRYEEGAEAHIHPLLVWRIPSVSEEALRLVGGNKMLLANAPDILLKQPIEVCAPKENHERWFAKGQEDYPKVGITIGSFINKWLIDFLGNMQCIDDLLQAYESSNVYILKQQHWYVFVTAAYMLRGAPDKARMVMEKHLGNSGLRKRYSLVYDNL